MKILRIETTRALTDEEWGEYKKVSPLNSLNPDWQELEKEGAIDLTQNNNSGENVVTHVILEET